MTLQNHFHHTLKKLLHLRVIIFIAIGIIIMFLTFLTDDNALEIAISGMASIFIGIGVNNLSSLEDHIKNGDEHKSKVKHSLKILQLTESKLCRICDKIHDDNNQAFLNDLTELEELINLSIHYMEEDNIIF